MRLNYDFKSIIENLIEKLLNFFLLSIKKKSKINLIIKKFENESDTIKLKKLQNLQLKHNSNPIPTLKIAEILFKQNDLNWINISKSYLEKIKIWKKKIKNKKIDNYQFVGEEFITGAFGNYWDIKNLIDLNETYFGVKKKICILKTSSFKITNKSYFEYFKPSIRLITNEKEKKTFHKFNNILKLPLGLFLPVKSEPIFREFIPSLILNRYPNKKIKYFKLKKKHLQIGEKFLRKIGLKRKDWFVTLHVRESLKEKTQENFRNSNPLNFVKAVETITSKGGFVFRMGDNRSSIMPKMKNFFDYAHSEYKSEILDIFLAAKSKFCIGTPSGFYPVAGAFGVPVLLTNLAQFTTLLSLNSHDIVIPRLIKKKKNSKYVKFKQIFSGPFFWFYSDQQFKKNGVVSVENDENDICSGVEEMINKILINNGKTILQKKVDKIVENEVGKLHKIKISPLASISNSYLKRHKKHLI